jgi:alginate O-acetyltransferase complex protein AlgI
VSALAPSVAAHALRERPHRAAWPRAAAWAFLVVSGGVAVLATRSETGLVRMTLVCGALFLGMKAVALAEAHLEGRPSPAGSRLLGFLFLWPGMRPWAFAGPARARADGADEVAAGLRNVALGVGTVVAARLVASRAGGDAPLALALLVVGLGLALHFGVCRVLVGVWRRRGAAVGPLFVAPHRARSLGDFWSRRWNLAFSEMAQIAVQRPLAPRVGRRAATFAGFLASGLLHEAAISVPAGARYGGPLLYFALHGALVLAEPAIGIGTRAPAVVSRAWTWAWLLAPLPLLFHRPFVEACLVPFLASAP